MWIDGDDKDQIDDDFQIEVEDVADDLLPDPDEEIEDAKQGALTAPAIPQDLEDEADDGDDDGAPPPRRAPADDDGAPSYDQRVAAAEMRAREVEARALMQEGQHKAEMLQFRKAQADVSLTMVNEKIDSFYQALAVAKDNGDTATELAVQRQIATAENLRSQIEAARASYGDPDQLLNQYRARASEIMSAPPPGEAVGAGVTSTNPLAIQWAKANGWMKTNADASKFVIAQSKALVNEGWQPDKRGFYAELTKRVQRQFPDLQAKTLTAPKKGPGAAAPGKKAPVAPARSSAADSGRQQQRNPTKFVLTAEEQRKMRTFKLDPKNKEHQRAWAESRVEEMRNRMV